MNIMGKWQFDHTDSAAMARTTVATFVWRTFLLVPVVLAVAWRVHHDPQTKAELQARLQVEQCWHDLEAGTPVPRSPGAAECIRLENAYEMRYAR